MEPENIFNIYLIWKETGEWEDSERKIVYATTNEDIANQKVKELQDAFKKYVVQVNEQAKICDTCPVRNQKYAKSHKEAKRIENEIKEKCDDMSLDINYVPDYGISINCINSQTPIDLMIFYVEVVPVHYE